MSKRAGADGLYQRGGVWWIRCDPVTGDRKSTGCHDREAARAVRRERERLAADPAYAAAKTATVGVYAARLLASKSAKRPGTLDMYRTKVGHVLRMLGEGCTLSEITPGTYDRYVAQRRIEQASDNTISKELLALDGIVQLAQRDGAWAGDPGALRPVGFSSGYTPRRNALSLGQVAALCAQLPPHRRSIVRLMIATGVRRSELQRLAYDGAGLITVHGTKTAGAERRFAAVTSWQTEWLTAASWSSTKWRNMNRDLAEASKAAQLAFVVTPNDLRRTFASWLIEAGVTREEVAAMLGHRGVGMVYRVYGRADAAKEGESIRRRLGVASLEDTSQALRAAACAVADAWAHSAQRRMADYADLHRFAPGLPDALSALEAATRTDPLRQVADGEPRTDPSQLPVCSPAPAAQVSVTFG